MLVGINISSYPLYFFLRMAIQKTILLLLITLICTESFSQVSCTGIFSGKVTDPSGNPLAGAAVKLSGQPGGQSTDASGNFRFEAICQGNYKVIIHNLGYTENSFEIFIDGEITRDVKLDEDVRQLKEVVIEDEIINTDHSHNSSSLNEKELLETAGKSLGESLKEITGVNTIQSGPGIFKPVIHGVHSQRVLILNYGIRQEGQQWGAEHAPEIDPFIASDIIVIKDASSIKYGTDALGGVIVINPPTLPVKNIVGGTFNTVIQSNGRSGAVSGMLEGGIKNHDGWGWRVQGTAKKSGDFHAPDYSLTNTGVRELNFSTATGYHKDNFGVEAFFSHFKSELGILKGTAVNNLNDLVAAMERTPPLFTTDFSYNIGEPRQEVAHNLLKLNGHLETRKGDYRIQYGFQNNIRKEYDLRRGSLSSRPAIDLKLNTHTLETEWETFQTSKRSLCIGLTGMLQENNSIYGTQRLPFIPDFISLSSGAFAVSKFLLKRWTADVGLRYDYRHYSVAGYDSKNILFRSELDFNNISLTSGATVKLNHDATFSTNLSTAWRPPHVSELYSVGTHQSAAAIEYGLLLNDSTNEVLDITQADFKIEQALKWVNTYKRVWDDFQFEASVYANYIFNYTYLRPRGVTQNIRGVFPYFRYTQTDALFLGLDISAVWEPVANVKIIPRTSYVRAADVTNGDYLIFIPPNRYEIAIRFEEPRRFALKEFYVESKVKYTSRQHRSPRVLTIPEILDSDGEGVNIPSNGQNFDFMKAPASYFLWNISAGFSTPVKSVKMYFRISSENVLNTTYREYTNRFRYYANDLGRNLIVSVKCIF